MIYEIVCSTLLEASFLNLNQCDTAENVKSCDLISDVKSKAPHKSSTAVRTRFIINCMLINLLEKYQEAYRKMEEKFSRKSVQSSQYAIYILKSKLPNIRTDKFSITGGKFFRRSRALKI